MDYGLKREVWGRVGPDPQAELQVNPAALESTIGNTSLCVALPEQANSHSSDASYHGKQGYNPISIKMHACMSRQQQNLVYALLTGRT